MAHAYLSASGSKRWMSCPPSAKLEAKFPNTTSEFAEEGTFAHSLADHYLRCYTTIFPKSEREIELAKLKQNKYYNADVDQHVQDYVNYVKERIAAAEASCKDAEIKLEQRLDFSKWVPKGFGTGDVVIVTDSYIEVIDLKFGKGVPVSAEDNSQMMLYALGAYEEEAFLRDIKTVKMTICQSRLDSVSSTEITTKALLAWADIEVKPKAQLAIKGEGEYKSGEHCKFCKAKATCRKRAEDNLVLEQQYNYSDPALLTDVEIVDILLKAEELKKWVKCIQDLGLIEAINGKKWPGMKLVEGRSTRAYREAKEVEKRLLKEGYAECIIYKERELLGITAMEKTISKKEFEKQLGDLIIKPAGKPVLVPETDKRPELNSAALAAIDFDDKFEEVIL